MLNRVVIVGRLTKDPDLRYTPNGVAVANFTVAANRPFKNQQGENEADFINCVAWRRQAENLANYMGKGNLIGVDGRIQTRRFEGQDGKTVFVTEVLAEGIQFLEPKGSSQNKGQTGPGFQQQGQHQSQPQVNNADPFSNAGEPIDISDDDLPF
ncbi:single-stranded DNA-binding protein [Virgibacillus sp. W0430]|uniref:single-stranded DNA-binding protein n=1 Tax=Virgibacillus sp. W0430 TaxID=3391580 RepID=UPI003F47FC20